MKIVIAGSSGLVGSALTDSLVRDGHTVVRLLRSGTRKDNGSGKRNQTQNQTTSQPNSSAKIIDVTWNPNTCDLEGEPFGADQEKIEGSDALVNLAGASIAGSSWSKERKAVLRSSRVH